MKNVENNLPMISAQALRNAASFVACGCDRARCETDTEVFQAGGYDPSTSIKESCDE